jgi:hypothetical protein
MLRVNNTFCAALLVGAIILPNETYAATGFVRSAKVSRVLAHHSDFGICAVELAKKNSSLDCSNWITFDCDGEFEGNTKAAANHKFNIAQLAWVTNKSVKVQITDNRKINGMCFANRIEVVR